MKSEGHMQGKMVARDAMGRRLDLRDVQYLLCEWRYLALVIQNADRGWQAVKQRQEVRGPQPSPEYWVLRLDEAFPPTESCPWEIRGRPATRSSRQQGRTPHYEKK